MRLVFSVDDEDAFLAARDELLDAFAARTEELGLEADDAYFDASIALDWKWGYADGDLGWWHTGHLDELLLGHYPRKVGVEPGEQLDAPVNLAAFMAFLADAGHLTAASDPVQVLRDHAEDLAADHVEAMGDRSRHGLAKSLLGGLDDLGIELDPSDPDSIAAAMEAFNALPHETRKAVTDGPMGAAMPRPQLPPVVLPPTDELQSQALAAPWCRRLRGLLTYLDEGLTMTQTGNLRLADGRRLVAQLETGDELPTDRRLRSTADLPRLDLLVEWVVEADLAELDGTRLRPTAAGRELRAGARVLEHYGPAVRTLLEGVGILGYRAGYHFGGFAMLAAAADRSVPLALLRAMVVHGLELDDWIRDVTTGLDETHGPAPDPATRRRFVGLNVQELAAELVELGLVTVTGAASEPGPFGEAERRGGTLALTDLGRWWVATELDDLVEVATAGALVDLDAVALLRRLPDYDPDTADAELLAWTRARGDQEAAEEVVAAVRDLEGEAHWMGWSLLLGIGAPAMPAVAAVRDDPALGPAAAVAWFEHHWSDRVIDGVTALAILRDLEPEDPEALLPLLEEVAGDVLAEPDVLGAVDALTGADPAWQVAVLAAALELSQAPVEMLVEAVVGRGSDAGEQAAAVDRWWRVPGEATGDVLAIVGREHADRRVAKTARKGLHRFRSR